MLDLLGSLRARGVVGTAVPDVRVEVVLGGACALEGPPALRALEVAPRDRRRPFLQAHTGACMSVRARDCKRAPIHTRMCVQEGEVKAWLADATNANLWRVATRPSLSLSYKAHGTARAARPASSAAQQVSCLEVSVVPPAQLRATTYDVQQLNTPRQPTPNLQNAVLRCAKGCVISKTGGKGWAESTASQSAHV